MVYVRIKPQNKRRGILRKRHALRLNGQTHHFKAGRWYEVSEQLATALKKCRQIAGDPDSAAVFDICTREEADAIDEQEAAAKAVTLPPRKQRQRSMTPARDTSPMQQRVRDLTTPREPRPSEEQLAPVDERVARIAEHDAKYPDAGANAVTLEDVRHDEEPKMLDPDPDGAELTETEDLAEPQRVEVGRVGSGSKSRRTKR